MSYIADDRVQQPRVTTLGTTQSDKNLITRSFTPSKSHRVSLHVIR